MSARKLRAWQQAGLIDPDTATRIQAWEDEHRRPLGIWALVGLGALAIALGIVSVVAANWDAIPGELRLALHLALLVALAGCAWWWLRNGPDGPAYVDDALMVVTAILGLTFFAHIGQVYQTSSPLWQPLLAWLLVFSPLLLLCGRGWPVALLWVGGVLGTAFAHATEHESLWWSPDPSASTLYWGLIATPPMLIVAGAAMLRGTGDRPAFWRIVEQLALIAILAGVSIAIITRAWTGPLWGSRAIHALFLLAAAGIILRARRDRSGEATAAILAAAALLHGLQALLSRFLYLHGGPWLNTVFFVALWAAVAYGALHAGWRHVFQGAIALIAARVIILSFELSDDLLGSGVSLIVSGIIAMVVAWASVRIARRYAPIPESAR